MNVHLLNPGQLAPAQWREVQGVSRAAFSDAFEYINSVTSEDIDNLTLWNDPERYYLGHLDPNIEVNRRKRGDQSYRDPVVAVAMEGIRIVGFGYAADNVSWKIRGMLNLPEKKGLFDLTFIDRLEEKRKYHGTHRRYLAIGELAVHPDYQHQGLGTKIVRKLLEQADEDQPVSAYVWPYLLPTMPATLSRHAFRLTSTDPKKNIFGDGRPTVRQERYSAGSAREVLLTL